MTVLVPELEPLSVAIFNKMLISSVHVYRDMTKILTLIAVSEDIGNQRTLTINVVFESQVYLGNYISCTGRAK